MTHSHREAPNNGRICATTPEQSDAPTLAALVGLLSPAGALAIARRLERDAAAPIPLQRRLAVLRLLIRWVDANGLFMTGRQYQAVVDAEPEEDWPTLRQLEGAFGLWPAPLEAAFDMYSYGRRRGRPSGATRRKEPPDPYTPAEIEAAIAYFYVLFEVFPRSTEYEQWAKLERRLAREKGRKVKPRLPDLKTIKEELAPFDEAVAIVRAKWHAGKVRPVVVGLPKLDVDERRR